MNAFWSRLGETSVPLTRSWSMMLNASLYSWICDWSNMAKMFDVARCWRFFGGFALAREAMIDRSGKERRRALLFFRSVGVISALKTKAQSIIDVYIRKKKTVEKERKRKRKNTGITKIFLWSNKTLSKDTVVLGIECMCEWVFICNV